MVTRSTKLDDSCSGAGTGDADAVYPVLFTGLGGNLPDATIDWFRKQKVIVARDSAAPTAEYGAMNWALAYGDWQVSGVSLLLRLSGCWSYAACGRTDSLFG